MENKYGAPALLPSLPSSYLGFHLVNSNSISYFLFQKPFLGYFFQKVFPSFFTQQTIPCLFRYCVSLLGCLNNRSLVSDGLGGQKSKIKVPLGLVFGETSLLGLRQQPFSCDFMQSLPCACAQREHSTSKYSHITSGSVKVSKDQFKGHNSVHNRYQFKLI